MSPRARRWSVFALVLASLVGAAAALVYFTGRPPEGPVGVDWDREVCARCRMHVSEPAFAAQLHTEDGRVLVFDDPGCAFLYLDESPEVRVHALYFHHLEEDRWIPREEVAFVPVEHSPMGYGFGAVTRGVEGALSLADARARVRALAEGRSP